jgi:hypothetical protein
MVLIIYMYIIISIKILFVHADSVFLIAKWNGFIDSEVTYIGRFNENIVFPCTCINYKFKSDIDS